MGIKQSGQKVVVWAKQNPILAGVLLIGVIALAYMASKNRGKASVVPTGLVDDAAGSGILGGGEDDLLIPYMGFDPVSGLPPLPDVFYSGGEGWGDYDDEPTTLTWIPEIFEPIVALVGGQETTTPGASRLDRMIMQEPGVWARPADTLHTEGFKPLEPKAPSFIRRDSVTTNIFSDAIKAIYPRDTVPGFGTSYTPAIMDQPYGITYIPPAPAPRTYPAVDLHPGTAAFSSTVKIGH